MGIFRITRWKVLYICLGLTSICSLVMAILLYKYESFFEFILTQRTINVIKIILCIYAGWSLIQLCMAVRTASSHNRKLAWIFLFLALITFGIEIGALLTLGSQRNEFFGLETLESTVQHLVETYKTSNVSSYLLDTIHVQLQCCGTDEWHREWRGIMDPEYDQWVPNSCCMDEFKWNKNCGKFKYQDQETVQDLIQASESQEVSDFPDYWFSKLVNDPCPEAILRLVSEWPIYALTITVSLAVTKMFIVIYPIIG